MKKKISFDFPTILKIKIDIFFKFYSFLLLLLLYKSNKSGEERASVKLGSELTVKASEVLLIAADSEKEASTKNYQQFPKESNYSTKNHQIL